MVAPFFRSYGLSTAKQKVQALETGGAGLMFGAETDYPDLNLNGTHRLNNNKTSVLRGQLFFPRELQQFLVLVGGENLT